MNILVINAGSSSLKYQLMNPDTGDVTAKGLCERIGLDGRLTHKVPATGKKVEKDIPMPTHKEAIEAVMAILVDPVDGVIKSVDEIDAVGHRVLHGGDKFVASCLIDDACKQAIRDCIPLGPLHNPANLMGIENGYDPVYGARPLKRYLQKYVETLAARKILYGDVHAGDTLVLDVQNGEFIVTVKDGN